MMNRFEEYLNGLDKKNLFMLYFSIIIAAGIFYYYVNYSVFSQKIEENQNKISSLSFKLRDIRALEMKIKRIKKEYKKYQEKILSKKDDLKYLKLLIATSDVLNLNDEKFVKILNSILNAGIYNGINPSYEIEKKQDNFKIFTLTLKGSFSPDEYKNFYNLIKAIEGIRAVKNFENAKIVFDKNASVNYKLKVNFWGVK
ncbi:hypothetical protein [Caminibacter sp.]